MAIKDDERGGCLRRRYYYRTATSCWHGPLCSDGVLVCRTRMLTRSRRCTVTHCTHSRTVRNAMMLNRAAACMVTVTSVVPVRAVYRGMLKPVLVEGDFAYRVRVKRAPRASVRGETSEGSMAAR